MALDWNDLKVFLALECGRSARRAAARLGASHSTVLRRLHALETALGAKLFDRTPDGLTITGPGARLLIKAQQIEAEVMEVERDIADADIVLKGSVRLTAPPTVLKFLLLPTLARFRNDYPDITLDVASTDGFADLGRRDADIAIRFAQEPDDYLFGRRLPVFHDAIYVAATLEDTAHNLGWIGWQNAARFAKRIAMTPYAKSPIHWRLPDLELQAQAARDGIGMVLLPCIMGDADPLLRRIAPDFTQPTLPAWLLQHPDLRRLERVRVFAEYIYADIAKARHIIAGKNDP